MYPSPGTATRHSRPPQSAGVPDWSKLSRGDVVRVIRRDGGAVAGVIDMLALDRSVLWVIQDDGRGRIMICTADRPRVVVVAPAEDAR